MALKYDFEFFLRRPGDAAPVENFSLNRKATPRFWTKADVSNNSCHNFIIALIKGLHITVKQEQAR